MKLLKIMVLVGIMAVMTAFGGLITADVAADEPEELQTVEEVEEIAEPAEEPEEATENVQEPEEAQEAEPAEEAEDTTPAGIIQSQTGLHVDSVKTVDSYGTWAFYEVFADGDIYAVTIKAGSVDVCQILN